MEIRKITKADLAQCHALIVELAVFEKEPDAVVLTIAQFEKDLANNCFDAYVCQAQGEILGMALYYPIYSTWKGVSLHLEDIIVNQKHRRKGIGTLLFNAVLAEAKKMKAGRLQWQVLEWNQNAIDFYKKYPAEFDGEWYTVRISNTDLEKLS